MILVVRGTAKRGWGAAAPTQIEIKKRTEFLEIVLCDLPFSRNQPLKSADD